MGKRPTDFNMEIGLVKQQLEEVTGQVGELVTLLGGSEIGPTKTKGLVALVHELSDGLNSLMSQFAHAEKWRIQFKEAEADRAQRQEKKRQLAEEREYQAQQESAKNLRELEHQKKITRNRTILAAIMAVAGFLAKELFEHYFGK